MKNKKSVFISIILTIFISTCCFLTYKSNQKELIEDNLKLREIFSDTISVTKIDFNGYSTDINFNSNESNVNTVWENSMTSNYIKKIDSDKELLSKHSKILLENYFNDLKKIHMEQIDFLIKNKIPMNNIEDSTSDKAIEDFKKDIEQNENSLNRKLSTVIESIKNNLDTYIKYLNIYNIKFSFQEECNKYNEYFKSEYESLMEKRFNENIRKIIKKELV